MLASLENISLNRRKFELKQKDIHLRGESGGQLKVHLKK